MYRRDPFHQFSMPRLQTIFTIVLLAGWLSACLPADMAETPQAASTQQATQTPVPTAILATPLPTRPAYQPGEMVDYIAQTGDTLPAIAAHFNTNVKEIRAANTFIPLDATTMPPGMPMKIPIYYEPLWGNPYQIIPDSQFINGPAAINFNPVDFVNSQPGWLKEYQDYAGDRNMSAGEIIQFVALNYSVSPRLLLALVEYQLHGLSSKDMPADIKTGYPLGHIDTSATGLYRQLAWAANYLNNQYFDWRAGNLREFLLTDGKIVRPDPWQNSASVALQVYFSQQRSPDEYANAISANGFAATFRRLFGDPWITPPHIPGSLRQPFFRLPFLPGAFWALTGGPHSAWGEDMPLAAIDFAPPMNIGGCTQTDQLTTAVADGIISRTGNGIVVLDLDGDSDERTGWVVFYLHIASRDKIISGKKVKAGDPLGHPSCEGGVSTGTHTHIARKYNGEWILADGPLSFTLEGWQTHNGSTAYEGYLERNGQRVTACVCSDAASHLQSEYR
jgi:LasA protease